MTVGVSHPAARSLVLSHVLPLPIWGWPPYIYGGCYDCAGILVMDWDPPASYLCIPMVASTYQRAEP